MEGALVDEMSNKEYEGHQQEQDGKKNRTCLTERKLSVTKTECGIYVIFAISHQKTYRDERE